MIDTATGSLTIRDYRFDRSTGIADLHRLGLRMSETYQAPETGVVQECQIENKVHLSFIFNKRDQLKSIVFYSLIPALSGWGDITSESEQQRAEYNAALVGGDNVNIGVMPWGAIQFAIDPRETIAKVWIDYK